MLPNENMFDAMNTPSLLKPVELISPQSFVDQFRRITRQHRLPACCGVRAIGEGSRCGWARYSRRR